MTAHWSGYLWVDACTKCGAVLKSSNRANVAEQVEKHRCQGREVEE